MALRRHERWATLRHAIIGPATRLEHRERTASAPAAHVPRTRARVPILIGFILDMSHHRSMTE